MSWIDPGGINITSTTDDSVFLASASPKIAYDYYTSVVYSLRLNFSHINSSQVGEYTCEALLNNNETITKKFSIHFQGTYDSLHALSFCHQTLEVSISPDNNSPFIRGTTRMITWSVMVTPPILLNLNATFAVSKNGALNSYDSRWILQNGTSGSLAFQPLNFSDAGNYTCNVTANIRENNSLIIPSSAYDYYTVSVKGKNMQHSNFKSIIML